MRKKINYYYYYNNNNNFSPKWCGPPRAMASSFTRFLDHTHDAPQSVGVLWTSDQLVADIST
jgi:hypothetical protein